MKCLRPLQVPRLTIALGTVFVLNSVALLIFPTIGALLQLTQPQFGLWAALASTGRISPATGLRWKSS